MQNSSFNNKPSKAFERPNINKSKPIVNKQDKLPVSVWEKFILFLEKNYQKFVPFNYDIKQEKKENTQIQNQCIQFLLKNQYSEWQELKYDLNLSDKEEQRMIDNFCRYLSRSYSEKPPLFLENWHIKMTDFVNLFEVIINQNEQPDLLKLEQLIDIIDSFNHSGERTFWFLFQLPKYLDNIHQEKLISSRHYKEIMKFGANNLVAKIGYELQKEFRLTRTALKEQAAQNLVQELGETETNLKSEIQRLQLANQDLQNQIETIKTQSFNDAIYQLAKSLQGEQQPVLDKLFHLRKCLDILSVNNEGLSPEETLTCFINLDALFNAFKSINITQFPENIEQVFEITGLDLDEHKYNYIAGSQFTSKEDKKNVKCVAPGWCVNSTIVTPAKVEEVTINN